MSKYSEHTRLGWSLGVLSLFFEISIGITYLLPAEARLFGVITVLEGGFALTGLFLLDAVYGKPLQLKPDYFKPPEIDTLKRTVFILGALFFLQIVMQFPLTVRAWHRGLAIMFAGPAEELFFRGLLLSPFIKYGSNERTIKIKNPFQEKKYLLEISPIEVAGIIFSSMAFMILHINYYGNPRLLITVFLSGVFLGLFYLKYRDLTANILAHFILNFIVVVQSFWMIGW